MLGHGPHGMFRRHGAIFEAGLRIVNGRDWLSSEQRRKRCERARKQLDKIGPWAYPLLKSSNRWPQFVPLLKALLAGQSASYAARIAGHSAQTALRIARMLELAVEVKCGCGRRIRHHGRCMFRRKFYPSRILRWCKRGHELSAKNTYMIQGHRNCKLCRSGNARRKTVDNRIALTRKIAKMLGDNRAAGVALRYYRPRRIARAALLLRAGMAATQASRICHVSRTTLSKLTGDLNLCGWRCPCGRPLAHSSRCMTRKRLEVAQGGA